jgi:hypothetical protein
MRRNQSLAWCSSLAALVLCAGSEAQGAVVLIDYGTTSGSTSSAGGNTWNTVSTAGATAIVDTAGASVGSHTVTSGTFGSNGGSGAGGLGAPSSALLGNLAVASATDDYLFSNPGFTVTLSGLNPNLYYSFEFVGSRFATGNPDTRTTRYIVTGSNTGNAQVNTTVVDGGATLSAAVTGSGQGNTLIYDGFDGTGGIPTVSNIIPTSLGVITFSTNLLAGNNTYINALRITTSPIPEPTSLAAVGVAACLVLGRRGKR